MTNDEVEKRRVPDGELAYAPRGFTAGNDLAGAFDFFNERRGLLGWVVRASSPMRPIALEVVCAGRVLTRSFAALARKDIDGVIGAETRAGFAIGWRLLDLEALRGIATEQPEAPLEIRLADTDLRLQTVCDPPTAALALQMRDRTVDAAVEPNTGEMIAELWNAPQFDDAWYAERVLRRSAGREECLLHYIEHGEAAGFLASRGFNPVKTAASLGLAGPRGALYTTVTGALVAWRNPEPSAEPEPVSADPPVSDPSGPVSVSGAEAAEPDQAAGPPVLDDPRVYAEYLKRNELLDAHNYINQNHEASADPWLHFAENGDRNWLSPNGLFDARYYTRQIVGAPPSAPFRHYLESGEAMGLDPGPLLDVRWYCEQQQMEPGGGLVLSDYLKARKVNRASPNPYFDAQRYLERYPDIAETGMDAFEHFYRWGQQEGRWGSDLFDANYVYDRYLGGDRSSNALHVFLNLGRASGWRGVPDTNEVTAFDEVRKNTAPGPLFEDLAPPSAFAAPPKIKAFAFYLPQFHAIPENDEWWGDGFTEWRNLGRGLPRYAGHYQPRIPRDLGFYNLLDGETMRRQVDLARQMGIHGFGFYYYNFNGHRLLEKPLDLFCSDAQIEFPFFLIWANENWTRRWDGMDQDILMRQDYGADDQKALVDDLARYMKHPSYTQVDGRPLFCVYRADHIPHCRETLAEMRRQFRNRHGLDPVMLMAQSFNCIDPEQYGFDGAFEFPPHKIGSLIPSVTSTIQRHDIGFTGQVMEYKDAVEWARRDVEPLFPLVRTAFPSWDNDARKQGSGMSWRNSTPELFSEWIGVLIERSQRAPVFGENILFINAWNEWCEGAYLEPDVHFGYAYLNALSRALMAPATYTRERFLLVGADARASETQRQTLEIGRLLRRTFGIEIEFMLLAGGEMLEAYAAVAPTTIAQDGEAAIRAHGHHLRDKGFRRAILNGAETGVVINALSDVGFSCTGLVSDLPANVTDRKLEGAYAKLREKADLIVFASKVSKSELEETFGPVLGRSVVRAHGGYKPLVIHASDRKAVRAQLGVEEGESLILSLGEVELRKGPDIFLETAEKARAAGYKAKFVWVGSGAPDYMRWIERDRVRRQLNNVSFVPMSDDPGRYLAAADALFVPSRDDPFPTVVPEGLEAGLPIVAFENTGGHTELLADPAMGALIPYLDSEAAAGALQIAATAGTPKQRAKLSRQRTQRMNSDFDFKQFCAALVSEADPQWRRVSVVVPNFNYADLITSRLESIFGQDYPLFEIIVLDDASSDDSEQAARSAAAQFGRDIQWVGRKSNSGSVFRQWKAGLDLAQGELVWIAEADDLSHPQFVSRAVAALSALKQPVFAFSDSAAIDYQGDVLYPDYKAYYSAMGDKGLESDAVFPADEFVRRFLFPRNLIVNASSVVWPAERLRAAFSGLGEEAFELRCAGDWRIYVEACRAGGQVAYVADPLNRHRRHDNSVTHMLDKSAHFEEVLKVLDAAGQGLDEKTAASGRAKYLSMLRTAWKLDEVRAPKAPSRRRNQVGSR